MSAHAKDSGFAALAALLQPYGYVALRDSELWIYTNQVIHFSRVVVLKPQKPQSRKVNPREGAKLCTRHILRFDMKGKRPGVAVFFFSQS